MATVILCDSNGQPTGEMDKLQAHQDDGHLHLAFSIFIFRNNRSELLLQKRAASKPLFGGLWANTCCSHPQGGDLVKEAEQRLQEECGFTYQLTVGESFVYQAKDPAESSSEYEYDTVLVADVDDIDFQPNPAEVAEMKWLSVARIKEDTIVHHEAYAPWLPLALPLALRA